MGRFAEALGVGLRGSIRVQLEQHEVAPRDVLAGRVLVSVTSPIERGEPIQLEIHGRERLRWVEADPDAKDRDAQSSRANDQVRKQEEVFEVLREQICLDVPARAYAPGEYAFPFDYRLPVVLPGSFRFRTSQIDEMHKVDVECSYSITARMPVAGVFVADLSHNVAIIVREPPSLKVPRRVTSSASQDVNFLFLFHKGTCALSVAMEADVVPLGALVRLQCSVENKSTRHVHTIRTKLEQTVSLNRFKPSRERKVAPSVTRTVSDCECKGVEPGATMDVTLTHVIQASRPPATREALVPTMRSHFLSFTYELAIECEQTLCWDTRVALPLVVTTKAP